MDQRPWNFNSMEMWLMKFQQKTNNQHTHSHTRPINSQSDEEATFLRTLRLDSKTNFAQCQISSRPFGWRRLRRIMAVIVFVEIRIPLQPNPMKLAQTENPRRDYVAV